MIRFSLRHALNVSVLLAASACAQQKTMTLQAADAALFDKNIPVMVVGSHSISDRHGYVAAGAGEGLGTGMLQGAGASLGGGAMSGNPIGLALGVVLAPVFAVGGGVYGAAAAHPSDETESAIAAIEAVYADSDLLGSIDEEVAQAFRDEGFSILYDCNQSTLKDEAAPRSKNAAIDANSCSSSKNYSRLRLEESIAFATRGVYEPDLIFAINVDAVAASSDTKKEAAEFRWVYISPMMNFFEASKADAAALRRDIASAQARLARSIVDDLHTARRTTRVTGSYDPDHSGINFFPRGATPGIVMRVPSRSQLINVSPSELD